MTDIIQLLPDHVANQIAAGEVVQRPASVVKELLENAIDAQAKSISLVVKDAGKTLIQVSDDGVGMSVTDARLSFERHATSKIRKAEDLFQLHTKGFRGEALASIAAISHVELKSKLAQEDIGTHLQIEGSEVISQEACVTSKGTMIRVKNLFYNIPARRNFLKSNAVETRHIIDEFQHVALAHPQVSFSMHHNGNELFQLPISNLRQRIVHVFGPKTNEKLVPVEEETDLMNIHGFVGKPEFSKQTRSEQFFFVNNRYIKSPYLNHAVNAAFEGLLKDKKHPAYFLFFDVDPKSIDINIHPTKTEIKFDDEHALYAILRSSIKHSLGQFNVAPILDFNRDADLDTPYDYQHKKVDSPGIEVDRDFNPFKKETGKPDQVAPNSFPKKKQGSWEALYTGLNHDEKIGGLDNVEFESEEVSGRFFDDGTESSSGPGIFQLQKKYIVSPLKSGMIVINQNRAHLRILYEDFLKNITVRAAVSQQLLFPLQLNFSNRELKMISELKGMLEQTGFAFAKIGEKQLEITGIPSLISESEVASLLEKILADFEQEIPEEGFLQTDLLAKALASGMAIKNGTSLNETEQLALVNGLFACKEPSVTPSNKNIFITLTVNDLDKNFN